MCNNINMYLTYSLFLKKGLEHLMHNLGLGGLEFSPTHTVDQHRPEGFILADIVIDSEITATAATEKTTTAHPFLGPSLGIPSDLITDENDINDITTESTESGRHHTDLSKDMWNSDLWQNIVFKQMHDPKHRHPRHHGKLIIKLLIIS